MKISEHAANEAGIRIFTCGYETRSRFTAQNKILDQAPTLVLDYECEGILSYNDNRSFFESCSTTEFIAIGDGFQRNFRDKLRHHVESKDFNNHIYLDVSSCSRRVMATLLLEIFDIAKTDIYLTCGYALSAFSSPPQGELPSHISEPVIGDLAGWSDDLSKPPCAVIGLGFEPGRALGCIDYLEIPAVRLFMPVGADARFESSVRSANKVLIDEINSSNVLPYNVLDPSMTYVKLESLVHGLLPNYRPVLIPLGPKILAALCIIIAIKLLPQVCVWRTSAGSSIEASDKTASGEIALFSTLVEGMREI